MNDITTVLSASSIAAAREAAQALRSGGVLSALRDSDVPSLLEIYRVRLNHLQSLPGSHAASTAASVMELLENLQGATSIQTTVLEAPSGRVFYIFLSDAGSTVVGCIGGVDRRKIPDEHWKELWEHEL